MFVLISLMAQGLCFADEPQLKDLEQRVNLLEMAFAPNSPQEMVETFAKAIKQRNGAVQYMLMCPALQKEHLALFQGTNWVTGTSSPSISGCKIGTSSHHKYIVHCFEALQGKVSGTFIVKLQVSTMVSPQTTKQYCVSAFEQGLHVKL